MKVSRKKTPYKNMKERNADPTMSNALEALLESAMFAKAVTLAVATAGDEVFTETVTKVIDVPAPAAMVTLVPVSPKVLVTTKVVFFSPGAVVVSVVTIVAEAAIVLVSGTTLVRVVTWPFTVETTVLLIALTIVSVSVRVTISTSGQKVVNPVTTLLVVVVTTVTPVVTVVG